jgi:hypothetical protein
LTTTSDLGSAIAARLEQLRQEPTTDVETAAGLLGISRGLAYQEAAKGSLAGVPVLRVGHRLRVLSTPLLAALGLDGSIGSAS